MCLERKAIKPIHPFQFDATVPIQSWRSLLEYIQFCKQQHSGHRNLPGKKKQLEVVQCRCIQLQKC